MSKEYEVRLTPTALGGWILELFESEDIGAIILGLLFVVIFVVFCVFWGLFWLIGWLWRSTIGKIVLIAGIVFTVILGFTIYADYEHEQDMRKKELEKQQYSYAYNLLSNGTYEVTGKGIYNGTVIVIDSEYEGIAVTRIGNGAFRDRKISSITIPDSVRSIGDSAFASCKLLTNIIIPNSVTDVGNSAFEYCNSLTNIVIPNSVTNIGDSVFANCKLLTNVILPDNMNSIPKQMFYSCESLKNVTIPSGVTSIGRGAFAFCDSLTSITIPESVTYIGELALAYDKALTTINYLGTMSQWEAIEKVVTWSSIDGCLNWDYNSDNFIIYCTDGIIQE